MPVACQSLPQCDFFILFILSEGILGLGLKNGLAPLSLDRLKFAFYRVDGLLYLLLEVLDFLLDY